MTTKIILTNIGNNKVLEAIAEGETITVSSLAYGDGNGSSYEPFATQTSLLNELGRVSPVTKSYDDIDNYIYFTATIPATVDAFTLREVGLIDEDGDLLAVGVVPDTSKPDATESIDVTLPISLGFKTSIGNVLVVYVGPETDFATKPWVRENFQILTEKGKSNGYAPLDEDKLIPEIHIHNKADIDLSNLDAAGELRFTNKADIDLSNLDEDGESHFANPSLSNLSVAGNTLINNKANVSLDNINNTGNFYIGTTALNNYLISYKSGTTVTLDDNKINYLQVSGNTTFTLPTVSDNSKFHQMLLLLHMPTVYTLNLGTAHYFYNVAPNMSTSGVYTLIYEWHGSYWYVGAIYKG